MNSVQFGWRLGTLSGDPSHERKTPSGIYQNQADVFDAKIRQLRTPGYEGLDYTIDGGFIRSLNTSPEDNTEYLLKWDPAKANGEPRKFSAPSLIKRNTQTGEEIVIWHSAQRVRIGEQSERFPEKLAILVDRYVRYGTTNSILPALCTLAGAPLPLPTP